MGPLSPSPHLQLRPHVLCPANFLNIVIVSFSVCVDVRHHRCQAGESDMKFVQSLRHPPWPTTWM